MEEMKKITLLPDSGDQETENRISSLEIAFDLRERLFHCFYFDYRQDRLHKDTTDRDQLFPTKLHPYGFHLRFLSPSTKKSIPSGYHIPK